MEITFKIAEAADLDILIQLIKQFCEVDNHPFDDSSIRIALSNLLQDKSLGRVWLIQQARKQLAILFLPLAIV
jgi:hypothetical protein